MIFWEFRPAMRLAFLLMPTDWMYRPRALFFSTMVTTAMHTAAMIRGVGTGPM